MILNLFQHDFRNVLVWFQESFGMILGICWHDFRANNLDRKCILVGVRGTIFLSCPAKIVP